MSLYLCDLYVTPQRTARFLPQLFIKLVVDVDVDQEDDGDGDDNGDDNDGDGDLEFLDDEDDGDGPFICEIQLEARLRWLCCC